MLRWGRLLMWCRCVFNVHVCVCAYVDICVCAICMCVVSVVEEVPEACANDATLGMAAHVVQVFFSVCHACHACGACRYVSMIL